MAVKRTGQMSFVEALVPSGLGRNERLERLTELVKWYRFEKLMSGLRTPSSGACAPPSPARGEGTEAVFRPVGRSTF